VIQPDGKRRRTHVFRIVLSHSRKAYSEAVYRQTTEDFIRCMENAFHHFGGAPQTLVIDNLKAAVTKADWFDPELNPKIQSFCAHYDTVILPTRPRTPRHKGKIERGVDYVQDNALKRRTFTSLNGSEPSPARLGNTRRRHPHPRHHPPAGQEGLRAREAGAVIRCRWRASRASRRPNARSIATDTSKWTRRTTPRRPSTSGA
jgi:transposase